MSASISTGASDLLCFGTFSGYDPKTNCKFLNFPSTCLFLLHSIIVDHIKRKNGTILKVFI